MWTDKDGGDWKSPEETLLVIKAQKLQSAWGWCRESGRRGDRRWDRNPLCLCALLLLPVEPEGWYSSGNIVKIDHNWPAKERNADPAANRRAIWNSCWWRGGDGVVSAGRRRGLSGGGVGCGWWVGERERGVWHIKWGSISLFKLLPATCLRSDAGGSASHDRRVSNIADE